MRSPIDLRGFSRILAVTLAVRFVAVDAVYAMARAVHELVIAKCGEPFRLCDRVQPAPPGPDLLEYIRNLTFKGKPLQPPAISFTELLQRFHQISFI